MVRHTFKLFSLAIVSMLLFSTMSTIASGSVQKNCEIYFINTDTKAYVIRIRCGGDISIEPEYKKLQACVEKRGTEAKLEDIKRLAELKNKNRERKILVLYPDNENMMAVSPESFKFKPGHYFVVPFNPEVHKPLRIRLWPEGYTPELDVDEDGYSTVTSKANCKASLCQRSSSCRRSKGFEINNGAIIRASLPLKKLIEKRSAVNSYVGCSVDYKAYGGKKSE